jgi:hypothetical protein
MGLLCIRRQLHAAADAHREAAAASAAVLKEERDAALAERDQALADSAAKDTAVQAANAARVAAEQRAVLLDEQLRRRPAAPEGRVCLATMAGNQEELTWNQNLEPIPGDLLMMTRLFSFGRTMLCHDAQIKCKDRTASLKCVFQH